MRNNGGGFESQASIVADVILPGVIAYSEDRNGKKIKEIKSDKSELDLPIMLINQNTAVPRACCWSFP